MLKKILAAVVVLLVGFAVTAHFQSDEFTVSRSIVIAAPPAVVFTQVNDLRKWEGWSPWAKLDPNAEETFSDPSSGEGASFGWSGNKDVGEGMMTIVESRPNDRVELKLEFVKPFKDVSTSEFIFKPEADQTVVTWTMHGKKNFIAKAVGLVMNCEKMIGGQFEQGLSQMKAVVEAGNNNRVDA